MPRLELSQQEAVDQPDIRQIIDSVALTSWQEASGKCYFGTGFLGKILLGQKEHIGFFSAGYNLTDSETNQVVPQNKIKLKFGHINKQAKKVLLSKLVKNRKYILVVAHKSKKIFIKDGQTDISPCREGIDFGAIIFTEEISAIEPHIRKFGLNYLPVNKPGCCGSTPLSPVTLFGFPQYDENSSMRMLPGIELCVPQGNIPDHCYTLETAPGAGGGSVSDKAGMVIALHIRRANWRKGDQGNWGIGFDIIREELLQCLVSSCVSSPLQPAPVAQSLLQPKSPIKSLKPPGSLNIKSKFLQRVRSHNQLIVAPVQKPSLSATTPLEKRVASQLHLGSSSSGIIQGEKSSVVLPTGWEQRRDVNGKAYNVNHTTRTTQWEHPVQVEGEERVQEDESPGDSSSQQLPNTTLPAVRLKNMRKNVLVGGKLEMDIKGDSSFEAEKEQRRTEKLRREQDENTQEAFDVRAEEYIDESENIKTQFQRFASLLIETTKCEKIPTLSDKEIDLLKKNWHIVIVNLLPFEADKIIKMIENISFHRNGIVNENESVSTMFKIFSSYVKMELISLEEVSEAFNCIGIYIFVNFSVSLVKKISSEAILRIHFPEKGIFFNSDSSSQAFCKHLQKEVVSSLSSQVALKWVKEKLKDDEDIIGLENYSFFDEFPFHKVDINVSYAYPGSTNCIVNIIFPEILENPQETNALIKIIETVLKKIKFLSKSNFTVDDQIETDHNILRLKLDVDIKKKKWNWWKRKDDLMSFLDGFVDDVRKNIISSEEEMMNILMENEHMTPGASQLLVSKLLKKDKFLIDIKTEKDLSVDTVRFKNIPVWPLKSRKLSELPIQTRIDIQNMMKNNFPKEICEEVAENLDVFRQDNNFDNLFESLNNIPTYLSPYIQIIKSYSEKQGTIDGLQSMLHYCLESTTIRKSINDFGKNPDEVINDMICQIDLQNERFFNEWWNTIKSRTNILENTCIANYQDFKKACRSKNTMAVLKDNVRNWDRHMKSIVQEGDQIWMWRDKFKKGLQYAHVGVYVGGGDMIHVKRAGLNGIITKEKAVDVIKDSKCFIVRPDPSRLRPEAGTPKRRAEACLGLTFLYSVTEGSCEVFVNCVTLGIWTTDCATLQGRDHPHVDNTLTAVNAVCNLRTRQTQRKDLLDQLAARLLENGFNDANCNQHARVRDIITPSMQQQASRENVQNTENVREPEDLEQSTESSSEIGENTTLGHNAETTSYTPNQQASSLHTSEDDADTNIRVSDSEVLKESSKIGQDTATGHHTETTSSTPNQQGSPVKMHQDDDTSEIGPNRNGTSLGQFLADIGLSQLQDAIEQEDVDFNMLVTSTNEELKDMGISKFGHRRKILDAARKIKGETMSLPSPNHSTTKMPEIIFDEEVPILPSLGDSRTQGVNKASTSKESYS